MSRNYYSEINLHIVWHTKNSLPLLSSRIEPIAYRFIKDRVYAASGVFLHGIGGTETHIHLAVTIPPTINPSVWIGELKGGSSHDVNQEIGLRQKKIQWQGGYGIVSFGTRDLEWVCQYIRNQQIHHRRGDIHVRLEQFMHDGP